MTDYTTKSIEELKDIDVTTGKSTRQRGIKKFLKELALIVSKRPGSSVSADKQSLLKNTEKVYEEIGKLPESTKTKKTKKTKVKVKKNSQKSTEQLSREGNADEILRRIKSGEL
jgi:hypothetical protein